MGGSPDGRQQRGNVNWHQPKSVNNYPSIPSHSFFPKLYREVYISSLQAVKINETDY